jgi:hypothetical protein
MSNSFPRAYKVERSKDIMISKERGLNGNFKAELKACNMSSTGTLSLKNQRDEMKAVTK